MDLISDFGAVDALSFLVGISCDPWDDTNFWIRVCSCLLIEILKSVPDDVGNCARALSSWLLPFTWTGTVKRITMIYPF